MGAVVLLVDGRGKEQQCVDTFDCQLFSVVVFV